MIHYSAAAEGRRGGGGGGEMTSRLACSNDEECPTTMSTQEHHARSQSARNQQGGHPDEAAQAQKSPSTCSACGFLMSFSARGMSPRVGSGVPIFNPKPIPSLTQARQACTGLVPHVIAPQRTNGYVILPQSKITAPSADHPLYIQRA